MVKVHQVLLGVLILHISVSAAPSEVEKVDYKAKIENTDQKLETEAISLLEEVEADNTESQRQKRWYNNFGFQPFSGGYFSSFGKKESYNPGYEYDDPLAEIHRRLQDINNSVKQPPPPPPPVQFPFPPNQFPLSNPFPVPNQFPFYLPVFYVPQAGCSCGPDNNPPEQNTPQPTQPTVTTDDNNTTTPKTPSRFPDLEDERQNFGIFVNETEEEEGDDVGRPISFDPIVPKRPMSRPAPPVEHGSSQGSVDGIGASNAPGAPVAGGAPAQNPTTPNPFAVPTTRSPLPSEPPSACDGAVLSCCHQLQVTYDCFALQGCPDPTSFGNPCDSNVILRVIDRFQRFYGQRTG